MKVLIVDDYPVARQVLRRILERLGAKAIVEAADGRSALEKLAEHGWEFDLILLDWTMPNVPGIEVARTLKEHPVGRRIPLIMVTGQSDPARVAEAFYAGATNYVVKPFTPETLRRKIAEVTTLRNLEATAAVRVDGGLAGDLSTFGFEEVVQYIQLGRRSGDLKIVSKGGVTARLSFRNGDVRAAHIGTLSGEVAFYEAARLREGHFELAAAADDVPPTIQTPTVHLLIEAMRRRDEAAEGGGR